jgi:hypothetical protein
MLFPEIEHEAASSYLREAPVGGRPIGPAAIKPACRVEGVGHDQARRATARSQ